MKNNNNDNCQKHEENNNSTTPTQVTRERHEQVVHAPTPLFFELGFSNLTDLRDHLFFCLSQSVLFFRSPPPSDWQCRGDFFPLFRKICYLCFVVGVGGATPVDHSSRLPCYVKLACVLFCVYDTSRSHAPTSGGNDPRPLYTHPFPAPSVPFISPTNIHLCNLVVVFAVTR